MQKHKLNSNLIDIFDRLYKEYGTQHWWPADEPFEVIVGAILTQSAAWVNVEKGISNLKKANVLSPRALREIPQDELAGLIHSCGYFNAKAVKLKAFVFWFKDNYQDSLDKMFAGDVIQLRQELLQVHGIGEETADSILLYAGNKPIFVIDAYTRRIIDRLGLKPEIDKYGAYQELFMNSLAADFQLFNEYHALLVNHGKNRCLKTKPLCDGCCLEELCNKV